MTSHHDFQETAGAPGPVEETLRMLAKSPAPDGLAERIHTRLRRAPRRSSFLSFTGVFSPSAWMHSGALRTAAAAVLVCAVAGTGWQLYSHVQPAPQAQSIVVPTPISAQGAGFSTSGAIAKPDPLKPPVITHQPSTPRAAAHPDVRGKQTQTAKPKRPATNLPPSRP